MGAIRSLINVKGLLLEYAWVMQGAFLVPVLLYDSESTIQMDNFRGLCGIRIMDRVTNAGIRKPCTVTKREVKGEDL